MHTHQETEEFDKCRGRNKRVCFIVAKDEEGWQPQKDSIRKLGLMACPEKHCLVNQDFL